MIKKFIAISAFALSHLLTTGSIAQEQVQVDYQYTGNANLASVRPALKIAEFSDSRGVADARLIADGYVAEAELAAIVRDAFVQAFTAGGVELVDSGEDMIIAGDISQSTLETVDRNGVESLQLTVRTSIQLQGRGRTIYETNLFGRGVVPVSDGVAAAVHASIDRMINDLTRDDYFMIELQ